jgi:hypothetical protein
LRMLAAILVLIVILPVPTFAEGSTGVCEMTITTSNTFYNKAGSTNHCNGQISGYYIDERFYISGQYHNPVEYSGQKFTVYLSESENTKDILTVYTQGKKEPIEDPEPDPEPEPEPVSEPERDNDSSRQDEETVPSRDKESGPSPDGSELPDTSPVKKESQTVKNTSPLYENSSWETEKEKIFDDEPASDETEEAVIGEVVENEEKGTEEVSLKVEKEDNSTDLKIELEEKKETSEVPEVINTDEKEVASLDEGSGEEGPSSLLALSLISLAVFAGGMIVYLYKPLSRLLGKGKYK